MHFNEAAQCQLFIGRNLKVRSRANTRCFGRHGESIERVGVALIIKSQLNSCRLHCRSVSWSLEMNEKTFCDRNLRDPLTRKLMTFCFDVSILNTSLIFGEFTCLRPSYIGVNAAGVTGVRTPNIWHARVHQWFAPPITHTQWRVRRTIFVNVTDCVVWVPS